MNEFVFSSVADIERVVSSADFVVTDSNVKSLYGDLLGDAYAISPGEASKTPDVLFKMITAMHDRGLTRGSTVCAVGGGVVGDIAGLAAALYMRGIEYINVPTTLLAIIDSSIGGKTAVNCCGIKNLVGAFYPPRETCVCYDFLKTLDARERLCGVGEMIKTCVLTADAFCALKQSFAAVKSFIISGECDSRFYSLIEKCVSIKTKSVTADPKECGVRKILNVGHTVGHALESANNYAKSHGEYVLVGMLAECAMLKQYVEPDFYAELTDILKTFISLPKTTVGAVLKAAASDKKNDGNGICIMLPVSAGDIRELVIDRDEFKIRYERAVKELRKCSK